MRIEHSTAWTGILLSVLLPIPCRAAEPARKLIFAAAFDGELREPWLIVGGKWEVRERCLRQIDPALDDPSKAILVIADADDLSNGIEFTARIRLDAWEETEYARAGIGLDADPASGNGLNLLFHGGRLQFMRDYVAWGPGPEFAYVTGRWYWMKMCLEDGIAKGKAWLDGDPEPEAWMARWEDRSDAPRGYPALVGSSGNSSAGLTSISFAECSVVAVGTNPSAYYAKLSEWEESMARSLEALSRKEAEIAALSGPTERWGPWHLIGPFHSREGSALATVFPPEAEAEAAAKPEAGMDLEKPSGGLRWTARPDWTDGVVHYDLPTGDDIACYLFRSVQVDAPKTIRARFGSDDGMALWLNGKRVLTRDVARSAAPDQDTVPLELEAGENRLLLKIHDHSGPSGFYFSPAKRASSEADDPLRSRLWMLLARDFPEPRSRREMAWTREDRIWSFEGAPGTVGVLAGRYAGSARPGYAEEARRLAGTATRAEDLAPIRELYYRSREVEAALASWTRTRLESLRLAVEDLTTTFGIEYPGGPEYLHAIVEATASLEAARGGSDRALLERALGAAKRLDVLRSEALLANPLLDFDRLLLVKRRDARTARPRPRVLGEAGNFVGNDVTGFLNGLPINFQGNGYLRSVPFDNEISVLSPVRPEGRLTTLHRPEKPVFVGDLKLHFDGDRLLFSSIGRHARWQIFEVSTDGGPPRQVTRGDEDNIDSYDACYLPGGRILFASSACFQSVPCERRCDEVANFASIEADGSDMRRLCFDQDHNFYPSVMLDGRVLYTRWEYTDIAHAFTGRLMTMNPDGTGQRAHYASNSSWPNRIFYPRPIPGSPSKFVGIVSGHHGTARAGELVLFDVTLGRRQAEGAVQRLPGRGVKVEAKMVDNLVDGSWPKFLHPSPLSDKYFLVSCQPTPESAWGIYLIDVFDNLLLLREEAGYVLFEPQPVKATRRPPVIPDRTDPTSREATVYLMDIYEGEGLAGIPRGTVKALRLFTYHFNYYGTSGIEDYVGMDGPWDVRRVLGRVPVGEDGSAYFTVPANTPIALQPLDAEGKAVQLMRSWFTAMPGEKVTCVGCHENLNDAPANIPSRLLASRPASIEPWHGPVRGFSWDREVQPVLDRFCVGCHDGQARGEAMAPPDLRRAEPRSMPHSPFPFPPSFYELRRFVRSPGLEGPSRIPVGDYHADSNPLVQMLQKGHHGVRLDVEAWDRLVTWIDMNAPAYGTWLEIPTVRDRARYLENPPEFFSAWLKPLSTAEIEHQRRRRMESLLQFGGIEEDPEAVPPTGLADIRFEAPGAPTPLAVIPPLAGWPFDREEARRRQTSEGERPRLALDLGSNITLELVRIPAGEFILGGREDYLDEGPRARVKIARPFWIGKTEVTNEQYRLHDPRHESGVEPMLWLKWHTGHLVPLSGDRQPACRVSWEEARGFCRWLSETTGKKFALPNEAEWEWACRAGTDTPWSFGAAASAAATFANVADDALLDLGRSAAMEKVRPFFAVDPVNDKSTVSAAVGSYEPNAWGLVDMHGNVGEWTDSAWIPYPFRADDPRHASLTERRTVRGGSWRQTSELARSGCRTSYWPWQRVFDVGFRVICEEE